MKGNRTGGGGGTGAGGAPGGGIPAHVIEAARRALMVTTQNTRPAHCRPLELWDVSPRPASRPGTRKSFILDLLNIFHVPYYDGNLTIFERYNPRTIHHLISASAVCPSQLYLARRNLSFGAE